MNLLFLTIEFQRAESGDDLVSLPAPRRPSLRERFFGRSIVPAAVAVCTAAETVDGAAIRIVVAVCALAAVAATGSATVERAAAVVVAACGG